MEPIEIPDDEMRGGERVVFAADQPEYRPLPALRYPFYGTVRTRWRLSENERRAILDGANVELSIVTFGAPLQPVVLSVQGVEPSEVTS